MAVSWRVVSTVPITGFDASNRAVPGRNVTYQLPDGTTGTVFVPDSNSDTDSIKAIIQESADRAAGIANLTSG